MAYSPKEQMQASLSVQQDQLYHMVLMIPAKQVVARPTNWILRNCVWIYIMARKSLIFEVEPVGLWKLLLLLQNSMQGVRYVSNIYSFTQYSSCFDITCLLKVRGIHTTTL